MKPRIIGLTGGIGSGKTLVSKVFSTLQIPVFHADDEAKKLYDTDPDLLKGVVKLFGNEILFEGCLNKVRLAQIVFQNEELLMELNRLVHPAVGKSFKSWYERQNSPYVLREAAILIESGSYQDCDAIILVTADESLRIKRVMKRSGLTSEEVQKRIFKQWPDEKKRAHCDFEIHNDEKSLLIPQILSIHESIIKVSPRN